jgi:hypothetical protein
VPNGLHVFYRILQLKIVGPEYRLKDDNHINDQGSRQLGIEYLKQFGNPLKDLKAN